MQYIGNGEAHVPRIHTCFAGTPWLQTTILSSCLEERRKCTLLHGNSFGRSFQVLSRFPETGIFSHNHRGNWSMGFFRCRHTTTNYDTVSSLTGDRTQVATVSMEIYRMPDRSGGYVCPERVFPPNKDIVWLASGIHCGRLGPCASYVWRRLKKHITCG